MPSAVSSQVPGVIAPWPRSFTLLRRLPERRDERLRERFFGVGAG
jgi:hypothetical protein